MRAERQAAGILEPVLPPGFEPGVVCDKWGNRVWPSDARSIGPLGDNETAGAALTKSSSDADVQKVLQEAAERLNRQTPQTVDEITRLDRASAGPGRLVTYYNTITVMKANEVDMDAFNGEFTTNMRRKICGAPSLAAMRRAGVTMVYEYRGSDGRRIGNVQIRPSDCTS